MALLSSKKKVSKVAPAPAKKAAHHRPKRFVYEPSHFVWLKAWKGEPRQPALVLYGESHGVIVVYVTPKTKGDTGRREVPHEAIDGKIVA